MSHTGSAPPSPNVLSVGSVDAGYAAVDDLRQAGADAIVDDLRELLDLVADDSPLPQ